MAVIDCNTPYPISGDGKVSYSFSSSGNQAIANAVDKVQDQANVLAGLEALNHECRVECPHKVVATAQYTITRRWSTRFQLWDLIASLFTWEWKYSGHVEFDWNTTITCTRPPHVGSEPPPSPFDLEPEDQDFDEHDLDLMSSRVGVGVIDEATGEALSGVSVRYRVLSGPLRFAGSAQQADVVSDKTGAASTTGSFLKPGASILVASSTEDVGPDVYLLRQSGSTTRNLGIIGPDMVSADDGDVRVRIYATDAWGRPVSCAQLLFEGQYDRRVSRTVVEGEVMEVGPGEYEGALKAHESGALCLFVQDKVTKASTLRWISVAPGIAAKIRIIGDVDPRMRPPYGEIVVQARLEDNHGNALDPARVLCRMNGDTATRMAVVNAAATFKVASAGHGAIQIDLADSQSDITEKAAIEFPAAWLGRPGPIFVGDTYLTPVYVSPVSNTELTKGQVRIRHDAELVAFEKFVPAPDFMGTVTLSSSQAYNESVLTFTAPSPLPVELFADGIQLGDILWRCKGAGDTCFQISAKMSPDTPEYTECLPQKARLSAACVCVNLIHPALDHVRNRRAWERALNRIQRRATLFGTIVSANVSRCCPCMVVRVQRTALTRQQINRITEIVGPGGISNVQDSQKFSNPRRFPNEPIEFGIRENCVNLFLWPYSNANPNFRERGDTHVGPVEGHTTGVAGRGVIDPRTAAGEDYTVAHEIGHAMGLTHDSASGERFNLMWSQSNRGINLNTVQCQDIWSAQNTYPCNG